jgi:hypothetical protein
MKMKYLQNFSQFELIFESNSSWPRNLDSFPTWQILSDMGSTYRTNRVGNFEILTPYKDFKITSAGYVRDPERAGTANDIAADFRSDPSVDTMLIWIIQKIFPNFVSSHGGPSNPKVQALQARIDSLTASINSKLIHPHLSEDQIKLLNICAPGWSYDPITDGIKVDRFNNISMKSPQYSGFGIAARLKILSSLKFSEISHLQIHPGFGKKYFLSRLPVLPDEISTFEVCFLKISSLEGSPQTVTGDFSCSYNQLTSLEGAPLTVEGYFDCSNNELTSLEGATQTVTKGFSCSHNQLTTLQGAPQTVEGDFYCDNNQLTTLEGAPQTVTKGFSCSRNQLTSLEGAPQTVGRDFFCSYNLLTSLEGAPQTVQGNFRCYHNQLTTLEGAPQTVGGIFYCDAFQLKPGKWNLEGWLEVLQTGSPEAQKLIQTIIGTDYWNSEISSNPIGTLLRLAEVWDRLPEDIQGGIKIPSNLQDDFDNFLDLERAGVY